MKPTRARARAPLLGIVLTASAVILSCRVQGPNTLEHSDGEPPSAPCSLFELVGEATHIYTAKVVSVDKPKSRFAIRLVESLKGTTAIRNIGVDLSQPQYLWQVEQVFKDLTDGQQAILLFKQDDSGDTICLLYTDSFFIQSMGRYDTGNPDIILVQFTHIELSMNRTFSGPTIRLLGVLREAIESKRSWPAAWPFVPELTKEALASRTHEPLVDFEDPEAVRKALADDAAAQPAKPKASEGDGTGLRGYYYEDDQFRRLEFSRIDPAIDFLWDKEGPSPTIGKGWDFSVRWIGEVQPRYSEQYTFYTIFSRGLDYDFSLMRIWVDGNVVCSFDEEAREAFWRKPLLLEAGKRYKIEMEFCGERALLLWSSKSQEPEVVPACQLYPAPDNIKDPAASQRTLDAMPQENK